MFIELVLVEAAASGVWTGIKKAEERANVRASLMTWRLEKPTPVIDVVLEGMAGTAETKSQRLISKAIVSIVRDIVNRKAFQYIVEGVVNQNSELRQRFPFLAELGQRSTLMLFIPLLFAGAAATYLHKKFPKATEAVAAGVAVATIWSAKQVGKLAEKGLDKLSANAACKRCGSPLTGIKDAVIPMNCRPEGFCSDQTCPYSDFHQGHEFIEG